jgi:hypothetical protein
MRIANLEVSPAPHSFGSVLVGVITVLDRVDLDDYFQEDWPHLDDSQRRVLVEYNKETIGNLMQKKCAISGWRDEDYPGGTVKKVTISRADLFGIEPRLSDDCLNAIQRR